MRMRCLALALACCSSGSASRGSASTSRPSGPAAPPPETSCAHVADHFVSLMSETAKEAPVEELDRVRGELTARCEQGGWSVGARRCFLALTTKAEVDQCASQLTPAQREALER